MPRKLNQAEMATISSLVGVKPTDSKTQAAEKAIALAISIFGEDDFEVRKMQRMLVNYKAREGLA